MMNNYVVAFLAQLTAEKQLSEHTVKNYQRDIKDFLLWHEQSELTAIDTRAIQYFIAYLTNKKMAASSIARKLSALRQFFDFLINQQVMQDNPAKQIKGPKKAQTLPKALAVDDINQLLDQPEKIFDMNNPLHVRNYAMMELLYSTGLRVSELAAINIESMDLASGQIYVIGKGNKGRLVLLGKKAITAIKLWLKIRQELANDKFPTTAVWLNQRGKRLSIRGIQLQLKQLGQRFNINLNLHPHMLRHTFASHVLQSSGNLRAVQEMLGHSDIASTQIYTHLDFQHLSRVYDKAHPRAHKPATHNKKD